MSPIEHSSAPDLHEHGLTPRLRRYADFVRGQRTLAKQGELVLAPDGLWLSITENCNFRCIGCYTEGLFKKTYLSVDDLRAMLGGNQESYSYISLTDGEAFLHPELCQIIETFRAAHPEAKIDLVTNASIPLTGDRRRAVSLIDSLGISIDGATKSTYEDIRRGGNFERFLANVREIVAVRAETGSPEHLEFSFTAMSTNLSELSGVVEIAAEIGVPNVYFQPMEMREPEIEARIGRLDINRMAPEDVYKETDKARALGASLGVSVYGAALMVRPSNADVPPDANQVFSLGEIEEAVRTCRYLWLQPFQYIRDGERFTVLPCCYMSKADGIKISERYGLIFERPGRVLDVYNGDAFWRLRCDLAYGKLAEFCGACKQAETWPWNDAG